MTDFSQKRFLIIAGQPKAGTTSLFDWMAQHPDIAPSTTKETRFFNDTNYPLPRSFGFDGSNILDYARNFAESEREVYLEATPDYLFNATSLEILDQLPNAKLIVVVRDPIDRITSAFHFYKQRGFISNSESLLDYVSVMMKVEVSEETPVHLRVLDQSRDIYVNKYDTTFDDRLLLLDFADILSSPEEVYTSMCEHVGLTPSGAASFSKRNETRSSRFPAASKVYYFVKPRIVYFLRRLGLDSLIPIFRWPNVLLEALLSKNLYKSGVDAESAALIRSYLEENP